jgi:hypothetical protein
MRRRLRFRATGPFGTVSLLFRSIGVQLEQFGTLSVEKLLHEAKPSRFEVKCHLFSKTIVNVTSIGKAQKTSNYHKMTPELGKTKACQKMRLSRWHL